MSELRRLLLVLSLLTVGLWAATPAARPGSQEEPRSKDINRIQESITTLSELANVEEDGIPKALLKDADGIVVIPSLVKGGFVVGAEHGRGVMSARNRATSTWSVPIFVTMTGGTIGWQIGVQAVDLVLLIMNRSGVDSLLDDKFTLGGELSVAAGPVGRTVTAATDAKVNSQILAYSRAKGLFAGATLNGAALHPDGDANRSFYGRTADIRALLNEPSVPPRIPAIVAEWRSSLTQLAGLPTSARRIE
jgi:lipid-binding SYLF domain-containing protein